MKEKRPRLPQQPGPKGGKENWKKEKSDKVLFLQLGDLGIVVTEDGLQNVLGVLTHGGSAAPDLSRRLAHLRGNAEGFDLGTGGLVLILDPVAAGAADGYIVSAKSATSGRYRDVSLFYVDAKTPGLDDSLRTPLIGMKNSPTGVVRMKNCKVPRDCLIGQENSAYGQMKILLNEGRLDMAALAVGIAQGAMECSVKHTSQSGHFGRSLSSYQGVSFQVARMYEKIFMARNSLYTVAEMFRRQERATMEVAALKLFATEMCLEVCRAAVQLYGAKGLSQYTDVDRYFRDAQMLTIGEGSSEVCQIVISGKLYHTQLDQY